MSDREELVKRLDELRGSANAQADFILSREQRLRDEHLKVLEAIKEPLDKMQMNCVIDGDNRKRYDEALSIITAEIGKKGE